MCTLRKSMAELKKPKMKNSMTSLDVLCLRKELRVLEGAYVDKAFGSDDLYIRFNTEQGKKELAFRDGAFLFLTPPLEHGEEVGRMAQFIRKEMDNARVLRIPDHGMDRFVTIEFQWPASHSLHFELMARGNAVIVADSKIRQLLRGEKRGRMELVPGAVYSHAPLRFDVLNCTPESFISEIRNSGADVVRTLAARAGLGGELAEETCSRAGVQFSAAASEIGDATALSLYETAMSLIREALEKPSPALYYQDGAPFQFTPVPFIRFEQFEHRSFPTLSEAIAEFVVSRSKESQEAPGLDKQIEAVERLRSEANAIRTYAQLLKEDSSLLDDLMKAIVQGTEGTPNLKANRDGTYSLVLGGAAFQFKPSGNRYAVLSSIFDAAKEAERKLHSAEQALESLRSRPQRKTQVVVRPKIQQKRFWFEVYRWFVSSQGCLVLGGKDARSNERLVQKHMEQKDRYAHADFYGAPSVVVKWNEQAGEETLEEACIFAVCFSRAWNAHIASASAYWVYPDQVSKTPEAGEYLKKGAFIIRGKRNYFQKLPLRLAIGPIEYEGTQKMMCAPESAVASRTKDYFLLIPGDSSREKVAAEVAEAFGWEMENILPLLPGKCELKKPGS